MKNKNELRLDIVSRIEEEIIERASLQRSKLINKPKMQFKKKVSAIAILAATFILVVGGVFMALLPNNQVPVYEGMTVSGSNPMTGVGSENLPSQNAQVVPLGDNNNGNNGNHYGHYKGDHVKEDEDIDQDNPYGDGNETIDEVIEPSVLSPEAAQDMYYANPGEDVYVVVHIDNHISNIFTFIFEHIAAETDLEGASIDDCAVKGAFAVGETDFAALNVGVLIKGDSIHIDPAVAGDFAVNGACAGNIDDVAVLNCRSDEGRIVHVDDTGTLVAHQAAVSQG